jgi:organic radical activating enzyme
MYCPAEYHDNYSASHSLDTLQQAWISIWEKTKQHQLPYKISFTGGELTTNKHFLPFVEWLKKNYESHIYKLMFSTTGSANYRYYLKMFEYMDNITFSVHSEHIHEQKFFDMIVQLKQNIKDKKFIQVCIMNEHWNQARIPIYTKLLEQHNVSYTINEIQYNYQTRSIPIMKGKLDLNV